MHTYLLYDLFTVHDSSMSLRWMKNYPNCW